MKKNTDMISERIFLGAFPNVYLSPVIYAKISEIARFFGRERVPESGQERIEEVNMRLQSVENPQMTSREGRRQQGTEDIPLRIQAFR